MFADVREWPFYPSLTPKTGVRLPLGTPIISIVYAATLFVSHKYTTKMSPNVGGHGWSIASESSTGCGNDGY